MSLEKKRALGTYAIGKICQVAPITVGRWIDEGKLPFFTTGGGHRRVWAADLIAFLKAHNYPIPKGLNASPKMSVLIVEDDATLRRLIRHALEKTFRTLQVFEAADGYSAGESVAALSPSLVILDIWLPGVDGFSVCQRIRQNKSLKGTKILAITGEPSEKTREKIMKAGANAFLEKPFKIDAFQNTVSRLLDLS